MTNAIRQTSNPHLKLSLRVIACVYFLFAIVDLVVWFIYHGNIVRITESDPVSIRTLAGLTQLLAMLPTPSLLFWGKYVAARFFHHAVLQFGMPGLLYHLSIECLALLLGIGLVRSRSWAIRSLAAFCVLALAANLYWVRGLMPTGHLHLPLRDGETHGILGSIFFLLPNIIGISVSTALLVQFWRAKSISTVV
jgi:hypothetical protein